MTATIPATARPAPIPLYDYQRAEVDNPARFAWSCWSRQVGKSFCKSLKRTMRGIQRRRNQIFLSAGGRQSRELMLKARAHCEAMRIATSWDESFFGDTDFKQLEIGLPGGARIIGLPANPETARGYTGDVFLDEMAMHRYDREIYAAVYASAMRGGGEIDVCSTPKGRKNTFYLLQSNDAFDHSTVTIHDAVAGGLDVDVDELRAGMPYEDLWRQEFLCEFLDEATALLTYEMIAACEDPRLDTALDLDAVEACGHVVVGADIGRKRDLTAVWAFAVEGRRLVSLGLLELHKTPFQEQFEAISNVLACRSVRRLCIDASGLGMQLAEQLAERFGPSRVEQVTFTNTVKESLAMGLLVKVQDASVRIPAEHRIRNDWHSIERQVTAAGNVRYAADRNEDGHADRFWAAALAVMAADQPAGKPEGRSAGRLAAAAGAGGFL